MSKNTYYYRIRLTFRNGLGTAQVLESKFMTSHPSLSEVVDFLKNRLSEGDKITGMSVVRYVVKEEGEVQPDGSAVK